MSANRLTVLVTLMLAVALFVTESGNAQMDGYAQSFILKRSAVSTPQKYCGKKLSNALQIICDGVYNSMFKRTDSDMEMADYPITYDFPPFMSRAKARGLLNRRERRQTTRGIHEECCLNGCTINELTSYCGP